VAVAALLEMSLILVSCHEENLRLPAFIVKSDLKFYLLRPLYRLLAGRLQSERYGQRAT
jgi:hypothetical protein